jgi:hypothetical protein
MNPTRKLQKPHTHIGYAQLPQTSLRIFKINYIHTKLEYAFSMSCQMRIKIDKGKRA